MKILLMRHGEAMDDITDSYGGWADDVLTEKGKQQVYEKSKSIQELDVSFDKIYTSPLKRAFEVGEILGHILEIPVEKVAYAREFNGYGILSGENKELAAQKYSDQIELLVQTNDYLINIESYLHTDEIKIPKVLGAESVYSFTIRVQKLLAYIENTGDKNVIIVTHGGVIGMFFRLILKQKLQKREDCGWVLLEGEGGTYNILSSNGVE